MVHPNHLDMNPSPVSLQNFASNFFPGEKNEEVQHKIRLH